MTKVEKIIKDLELQPHPEGGYFKETYRSMGLIDEDSLGAEYDGQRNFSTGIYFLLPSNTFSAFHKINQDEIWHFYDGSPVRIHMISKTGDYSSILVGRNFDKGETLQFVVPGGYWFAARVENDDHYSLVGCTVAPGFDFRDFVIADRQALISNFPKYRELITAFTHE
jgi:predicted cupin superfamily sugar epimerase